MKKVAITILIIVLGLCSGNVLASEIENNNLESQLNLALENEDLITGELLEFAISNGRVLGSDEYYYETITNLLI